MLCLKKSTNPSNGQNVHRFQVRTPICHIVPVSRAYGYMGGSKENPPKKQGFFLFAHKKPKETRKIKIERKSKKARIGGSGMVLPVLIQDLMANTAVSGPCQSRVFLDLPCIGYGLRGGNL